MSFTQFSKRHGILGAAIAQLTIDRDNMKHNIPINQREGDKAQAKHERSTVKSIDAALNVLKHKKGWASWV